MHFARNCWAEEALVGAKRASGVGLGGVSRALLNVVCGDVEPTADEAGLGLKTQFSNAHARRSGFEGRLPTVGLCRTAVL